MPHVNVISKLDLVRKKKSFMEKFFNPDMEELVSELNEDSMGPKYFRLSAALGSLLVSFVPLVGLFCSSSRSLLFL